MKRILVCTLVIILATASLAAQAISPAASLTRAQAEQMAIKNNPAISISKLLALAQHEAVREQRSFELPNLQGSLSAVKPDDNASRISGFGLTSSRLIEHVGGGAELTQLITDFGRTPNLVAAARLTEKAQVANSQATTADIVLATDQAFYDALRARATLRVAQQTQVARQAVANQVTALTNSKLKSTLDQSFAEVNLSQAQLLVLDAQNNFDAARAQLNVILGIESTTPFELADETTELPVPRPDSAVLVAQALRQRPDLLALNDDRAAADKFRIAQRDQMLPTVSAVGTAGATAVGDQQNFPHTTYGAIGLSVEVPIFNGLRDSAQTQEASYRARIAQERVRDLRARIVRDVYTSWLAANSSFQRVAVTQQLLKQSDLALRLAETRYELGISSIVELNQAQLQETEAAISDANARYEYRFALSTLQFQTGSQP